MAYDARTLLTASTAPSGSGATTVAPALPAMRRRAGVLPGFRLSLGYTLTYLSLIVLIPLAGLAWKSGTVGWGTFVETVTAPRALAAYKLTFLAAGFAAAINVVFGLIVAWVLARYQFPGKGLVDALVDLPFALPTAVAGIALTALYSENGWLGRYLEPHGFKVAFAPAGIVVAMVFVGLPFVVRTVQPVLLDLDAQLEEVAATLGASRFQIVTRIILPSIIPSALTGAALAFARGVGEYGSIVFISGNMPMRTEIVPLLIVTKLEQFDYPGATAIALVMLLASFVLLFCINMLQAWARRATGAGEAKR
jgi:sulfate transport system permease protein